MRWRIAISALLFAFALAPSPARANGIIDGYVPDITVPYAGIVWDSATSILTVLPASPVSFSFRDYGSIDNGVITLTARVGIDNILDTSFAGNNFEITGCLSQNCGTVLAGTIREFALAGVSIQFRADGLTGSVAAMYTHDALVTFSYAGWLGMEKFTNISELVNDQNTNAAYLADDYTFGDPTPEPDSVALIGVGLAALCLAKRRLRS